MRLLPYPVIAAALLTFTQHSTAAKQIQLLHGQLSFVTLDDVSDAGGSRVDTDRYSILADLASADHTFSAQVTYGKQSHKKPNLADFLHQKVSMYSKPSAKLPHFHWLNHELVERQGEQWAAVSFTHDNVSGSHVYTRCLSRFVRGRLLEIWALTRRAGDPTQRARVDRLVESIHLAPTA